MATVFVPLDRIQDSPFQPRRHYDEATICDLADSIERDGPLQTPVVRPVYADGSPAAAVVSDTDWLHLMSLEPTFRVQLAYGHRRARAWRLIWARRAGDLVAGAGIHGAPPGCMPVELAPLTDEQMFARGVAENRQREGISAVEEAEAMHAAERTFGWTHEAIGERFGYSRSAVSNKLRLLKLPADVRELNVTGRLPERTARALVRMYDLGDELRPFADAARFDLHQLAGVEVAGMLDDGATHEQIAARVDEYVREVERAAAQARREREPEMFDEAPEAEPDVPAENIDEIDAAGEIDDIDQRHSRAIGWITDAGQIGRATDGLLSSTLQDLRALVRRGLALFEEMAEEQVVEHGPRLELVTGAVRFDVDRIEREVARRDEAFDDGGAGLKAAAAGQGLPPYDADAERAAETGEEMEPAEGDAVSADSEAAGAWPVPVLPDVFHRLHSMTKAQLLDVNSALSISLTTPNAGGQYGIGTSSKKQEILDYVTERLNNTANLVCAMDLTDDHVDEVGAFLESLREGRKQAYGRMYRTVGHNAETAIVAMERTLAVVPMSEAGAERYRRAAIRRLLATCYVRVREAMAGVSADTSTEMKHAGDGSAQPAPEVVA